MAQSHLKLVFASLLLITGGLILISGARSAAASFNRDFQPFPQPAIQVVRAYYSDRTMVDDLAAWLEPWEVHHDQGYLVVGVTPKQANLLRAAGFRLELDLQLTQQINTPSQALPGQISGIPGYACYRTVEETSAAAQALVTAHPELAALIDIGDSWDKYNPGGLSGYDIQVLRITNSAIPGPKPKLFVMASIHAREYAPAELVTRFGEYLLANYDLDPDVTWLVDYHEIHLLLQSNPDGRKFAESGISWRKNTNQNYCSPTSSSRGADLNRNFAFQWGCCGGSSITQCSETYRGPSPASEPETQAVQSYVRAQFPDQRDDPLISPAPDNATGVFLDIHSYGRLVLWPWGFTLTTPPNSNSLQTLGRKFAYFNGYDPSQSIDLYVTDGTTDDFAYGDLGLAAYTFEVGGAFFETCSGFQNHVLPANMPALLYAAKIARTPYVTPLGPDTLSLTAVPLSSSAPGMVQINATIDDTRYSQLNGIEPTQSVATAEYTIDAPPWSSSPTPIPQTMTAVDGFFDQPVENVTAVVDTFALVPGRHIIFVRGIDSDNNWGPVSAVFIDVPDKIYLPLIVKN
jgi:carboxypeptidase T